jgi:8-oxo-dGTP pyrophosphatase MutT (NUDIX family)
MSHSHDPPLDRRDDRLRSTEDARPARTPTGRPDAATSARKVCAYITRGGDELLAFEGPGHDALQVPKGTIEGDERPRAALAREVREETGLDPDASPTHLASDVWTRRLTPPRHYVRHFYHLSVEDSRDEWTHVVTGSGEEAGAAFEFRWLDLPTTEPFALGLDDYLPALRAVPDR